MPRDKRGRAAALDAAAGAVLVASSRSGEWEVVAVGENK